MRNRQSVLIILISQIIFISAVLAPYFAIERILDSGLVTGVGDSVLWQFGSLCDE